MYENFIRKRIPFGCSSISKITSLMQHTRPCYYIIIYLIKLKLCGVFKLIFPNGKSMAYNLLLLLLLYDSSVYIQKFCINIF